MSLRWKTELVVSTLELMLASYDEIRCPVAWLISELKGLVFDGGGITGKEGEPSKIELSSDAQVFMERMKMKNGELKEKT